LVAEGWAAESAAAAAEAVAREAAGAAAVAAVAEAAGWAAEADLVAVVVEAGSVADWEAADLEGAETVAAMAAGWAAAAAVAESAAVGLEAVDLRAAMREEMSGENRVQQKRYWLKIARLSSVMRLGP
jgi:hypothetical protein